MEDKTGELVAIKEESKTFELKPKDNCKVCLGKGVVIVRHPSAMNVRVIEPCQCVKKTVTLPESELQMPKRECRDCWQEKSGVAKLQKGDF